MLLHIDVSCTSEALLVTSQEKLKILKSPHFVKLHTKKTNLDPDDVSNPN